MQNTHDIEGRLTELEIKSSFADDLLEQLNQTILLQQQQIEKLTRQLAELRDHIPDGGGNAFRSLRDELPPHY